MKKGQPHIVMSSTLILEKEASHKNENHQVLLDRLSSIANNSLPSLFDESFNKVVPEDEIWHINKLELELGVDNLTELEEAIRRQLPDLIKEGVKKASQKSGNTATILPTNSTLGTAKLVLHYLRTGTLPWNSPGAISLSDIHEIFDKSVVADSKFVRKLCQLLLSEDKALERFLLHFEKLQYWHFYKEVQRMLPRKKISDYTAWDKMYIVVKRKGLANEKKHWHGILNRVSLEEIPKMPDDSHEVSGTQQSKEIVEEKPETISDPVYLQHAGLIFLHPFMTRYLEGLQLVRGKEILHPHQAASVLYSLVTGTSPEAEWELMLPKVLLGISTDTVLEICSVKENQIQEGLTMIQSAIEHWSALGSISVAGFRAGFLQRPGRLIPLKEGWLLELEQAPYDMLIDRIPWQMSYIQLPWMHASVHMNI